MPSPEICSPGSAGLRGRPWKGRADTRPATAPREGQAIDLAFRLLRRPLVATAAARSRANFWRGWWSARGQISAVCGRRRHALDQTQHGEIEEQTCDAGTAFGDMEPTFGFARAPSP